MKDLDAAWPQFWGARPGSADAWDFAFWAPRAEAVMLRLEGRDIAMQRLAEGVWQVRAAANAGARYRFVVDGCPVPDPASRLQDGNLHGDSVLVEPAVADTADWPGVPWEAAVILEVHIGTFTPEGTFAAAARRLAEIAALGFTMVEVMPIAQFPGHFGWGYDGVLSYAPHPDYGTPQDVRAFVAESHRVGLAVLLDVVYNHFGPEGAYLPKAAPQFFDESRSTPWGPAIDYRHRAVREYALRNAEMWICDYGFDGFRLDAVHEIIHPESPHLIEEMAQRLAALNLGRPIHLVTEDERNLPDFQDDGVIEASWNDDYHHSVHCLVTGENEGYYAPFAVDPMADLVTALQRGQVNEGQPRPDGESRGAPADHLPVTAFVNANQTHDQIGNRAMGERLISLAGPEAMRILHALLLTSPYVPMLFMGEEIGSRRPFQFFADFHGDLAKAVRDGRAAEFADFTGFGQDVPDPLSRDTLIASRPYEDPPPDAGDWRELTRSLLQHRADRILPLLRSDRMGATVEPLGPRSLHAEWIFEAGRIETLASIGAAVGPQRTLTAPDIALGTPDDAFAFFTKVTFT